MFTGASAATSIRAFRSTTVSVVDESYRLVNAPTVIDLPGVLKHVDHRVFRISRCSLILNASKD